MTSEVGSIEWKKGRHKPIKGFWRRLKGKEPIHEMTDIYVICNRQRRCDSHKHRAARRGERRYYASMDRFFGVDDSQERKETV